MGVDGMPTGRILVYSASFGAGHIRAAEALIEAIRGQQPGIEIVHRDCMEEVSPVLNRLLQVTYIGMMRHLPRWWGALYYGTAELSSRSLLQRAMNALGRQTYLRQIRELQPELIICSYPTVAGAVAELRRQRAVTAPLVTVVTDYSIHKQWIHAGVDLYLVGNKEVRDGLTARGIKPERIRVTGIPVSRRFEQALDRPAIVDRLGLRLELPTVLLMAGAQGVLADFREICAFLAQTSRPVQTLVVCGRNQQFYDALGPIIDQARNPVIRFGFVQAVEELMTVADLMITKAGGLIVSEALTKQLPMVVFRPIAGQEAENTKFLTAIGAARSAPDLEQLRAIVHQLLEQPAELEQYRSGSQPGHSLRFCPSGGGTDDRR